MQTALDTRMARLWQRLAIATNWPILVAVAVLTAIGIVSIWADSPADGQKQLMFLGIAFGCMALFQVVNYQKLGRFAWPFYVLSVLLILYTVVGTVIRVPGVTPRNGACNWIGFGSFTLQPSELMKVSFIMVLARYLRYRKNYRTFTGLLAPFALAMGPVALILKQPDLGTAIVFIPTLFAMLYVAGAKVRHLLAIVGIGLAFVPLLWFSGKCKMEGCTICPRLPVLNHLPQFVKHYQRQRVYAMFTNDETTLQSTGFQQHNALIAFGSGGAVGKGPLNVPVGGRVPEARNDMIFALIGEQFGFFGAAVVVVAYIVLFATGVEVAGATREPFGRLVALGIVAALASQTFLNLAVATKLMPVTGVTLPFISSGGSSLIASFMAAGLLLNIGQNRPIILAGDSFEFDEE